MAKSKKGMIGLALCVVLIVIALVFSIVVGANFSNIAAANGTVKATVTKTQASALGQKGARNIESEGAVLLKNANNTLPLNTSAGNTKITVLGTRSHHYVLGGTGSAGGRDDDATVMMDLALANAGIDYNETAWTWLNNAMGGSHISAVNSEYVSADDASALRSVNWTSYQTVAEFSKATYESNVKSSIGDYKTALVTFGRTGAEGASPSLDYDGNKDTTTGRHYLELQDNEIDLLKFCKENFDNTIVLINSAIPMEAGFINNPDFNIGAAIWIGHPGEAGMHGVADLLAGNVNPSGHLVDTFAYDMSTAPSFWSANDQVYTNVNSGSKYYQYNEGIYVGYRYYETADAEGYFDSNEFKAIKWKGNLVSEAKYTEGSDYVAMKEAGPQITYAGYDEVVQYPFGYGLSYSTFTQTVKSSDVTFTPGGQNTITVTVKNTGDVAGKDVVQIYLEAPYSTSKFGISGVGLEQSKVSLVGFAKTDVLQPGASQDVTVSLSTDDLATYDQYGQGCYVLADGKYTLHVSPNAHGWANEDAYGKDFGTVEYTLSAPVIYKAQPSSGAVSGATYVEKRTGAMNGYTVEEQLSAVNRMNDITAGDGSMLINGGASGTYNLGYLSRKDFHKGMVEIMSYQSDDLTGKYNGNGNVYGTETPVVNGQMVNGELRRTASDAVKEQIEANPNNTSARGINGETGTIAQVGLHYDYSAQLADGISFGDGKTGKYLYGYGNDGSYVMRYTPDSTFAADGDIITGVTQSDDMYLKFMSYDIKWNATYYVALDADGKVVTAEDGYVEIFDTEADAKAKGTATKLQAIHMNKVPMDDIERWMKLANMLGYYEADGMMGDNSWRSAAAPSIGKPMQIAVDGPGEAGNGQAQGNTWWPCAVIVAATWNPECAKEDYGVNYGYQAINNDKPYAYCPAMNTHRTPFGGRNFEYYSEDGFIAGVIGGSCAEGMMSVGAHCFIKHYALNDSDTNRGGVNTWADEASIRMIYAKPYEIATKYFKADGIMGSLNRMGMAWSHHGFYKQMTRDEWGWNGMYITDGDGSSNNTYNNYSFWTVNNFAGLLGGGKLCETGDTQFGLDIETDGSNATNYIKYVIHYVGMTAAYQYAHNIDTVMYEPNYMVPTVMLIVVDAILLIAAVIVLFAVALPGFKKR
ncbi:MAG: glycoside hydrolase family 3 protein [Clostridia bacterium]|nr:glycoside hydrolase family 3 protein [Clostridia bacterium]